MNSRLLTRKELVDDLIKGLLGPCLRRDTLINKYLTCNEQMFIDFTGLPLKRIRKNLYYI